jgi:hypothetical protein
MTDHEQRIFETAQPCTIHSMHKPHPYVNHRHHVWPLGEGGPDTQDNQIVVCPTGHANIHEVIRLHKLYMGRPPYSEVKRFSFKEREYGKIGFDRITRKSM